MNDDVLGETLILQVPHVVWAVVKLPPPEAQTRYPMYSGTLVVAKSALIADDPVGRWDYLAPVDGLIRAGAEEIERWSEESTCFYFREVVFTTYLLPLRCELALA